MNYKVAATIYAVLLAIVGLVATVIVLQKDDAVTATDQRSEPISQRATTLPIAPTVAIESSATTVEEEMPVTSLEAVEKRNVAATGRFKVIGKDIVDPEGNIFVPMGANVGGPLFDDAGQPVGLLRYQGHDITGSVDEVKAWGWNTIRLNSQCLGAGPSTKWNHAGWGEEKLFEAIEPVVDAYTSQKIVVMIDCHPDLALKEMSLDSAEYALVTKFWKEAARRYKDNPYVWFNHLNEFTTKGNTPYWQSVVDDGYKTFVDAGAQNIVLFDLPNHGQGLSTLTDPSTVSWAKNKCNIVWDWHSYGGLGVGFSEDELLAKADSLLASVASADLPLVVGEFGHDWNGTRRASNFNYVAEYGGARAAMTAAPKYGYGLLAWHANGDNAVEMKYGLKNSDDLTFDKPTPGAELSDWGQIFWDISQKMSKSPAQAGPPETGCTR